MTRKKRKRRTKRIGISLILWLAASLLLASGADKKAAETNALVAGTVFQESGYALPGADITLTPSPAAKGSKTQRAFSNSRGEFVFHVPAGPARFNLVVSAKGFQDQQKLVQVQGAERVDVTFQLAPQSK